MPYSADSDNLPSNVKAMPAKKKAQWVHIFNSAVENGDDEETAFKKANGSVKEKGLVPSIYDVDMRQVPMSVANYDPFGANEGKGCATCQWYISPDSCVLVQGDISPSGISKFYTQKVEFETPPLQVQIVKQQAQKESLFARFKSALGLNGDANAPTAFSLVRTKEGALRFFVVVSNNFKDRDGEVLSEAAHKEFVQWATEKEAYPELWLWHTPGTKFGQGDFIDYVDGFVIGSGLIDEGKEDVALAIEKQGVGVSHGFFGIPEDDKVYKQYRTFEWSPLPLNYAANEWTAYSVLQKGFDMPFTEEKRKFLQGVGVPDETISALEKSTGDLSEHLKALGVVSKEATQEADQQEEVDKVEALTGAVTALTETVKQVSEQVALLAQNQKSINEKVEKSHDDIVAEALTSAASKAKETVHRPTESSTNILSEKEAQQAQQPSTNGWFNETVIAPLAGTPKPAA